MRHWLDPRGWFSTGQEKEPEKLGPSATEISQDDSVFRGMRLDATQPYLLNSGVAWACIDRTAKVISKTPIYHRNMDEDGNILKIIREGPAAKILRSPLPAESWGSLFYEAMVEMGITGESVNFIHRDRNGHARYIERVDNYNRIRRSSHFGGYIWECTTAESDRIFRGSDFDILHFRGPFYGSLYKHTACSPFEYAAAVQIGLARQAQGRIRGEMRQALQDILTQTQDKDIRQQLADTYAGQVVNKPNRVAFWPPQVEKISRIESDVKAPESVVKLTIFEICMILGWPPQLMGFSVGDTSLTGSLVDALNKILFTTHLDPLMSSVEDEVYLKLVPELDKERRLTKIQFDAIPFRLTELERAEITETLVAKAGIINRNEGRLRHSYAPVRGEIGERFADPAGTPSGSDDKNNSNRKED